MSHSRSPELTTKLSGGNEAQWHCQSALMRSVASASECYPRMVISGTVIRRLAQDLVYRFEAIFHLLAVIIFGQPLTSSSGNHFCVP